MIEYDLRKDMSNSPKQREPIASSLYDHAYYLQDCNGHVEFEKGGLSSRLAEALNHVTIQKGMKVLDVGCGRGEVIAIACHSGAKVWGIDYALAAVKIASNYLEQQSLTDHGAIGQSNARQLPYADATFDLIVMLDIVEHLHPYELQEALQETNRVLRSNGTLLVHTGPNLWYYRFGYPLYRAFRRLQGQVLPKNPKDRFPTHNALHVNEQSPHSLRKALTQAGFKARVWVEQLHNPLLSIDGPKVNWLLKFVTNNFFLKWIFCGDIFALAEKTH